MTAITNQKQEETRKIVKLLRRGWIHLSARELMDFAAGCVAAVARKMTLRELQEWREHLERCYPEDPA